jgi:hypothetical protein
MGYHKDAYKAVARDQHEIKELVGCKPCTSLVPMLLLDCGDCDSRRGLWRWHITATASQSPMARSLPPQATRSAHTNPGVHQGWGKCRKGGSFLPVIVASLLPVTIPWLFEVFQLTACISKLTCTAH